MSEKGLCNLGNTCYMNAVLQMLVQNEEFSFIINENRNSTMTQFINQYYQPNNKPINPIKIKEMVSRVNPTFGSYRQQDCHEFFNTLMNILANNNDNIYDLFKVTEIFEYKCLRIKEHGPKYITNPPNPYLGLPLDDCDSFNDCFSKMFREEILQGTNAWECEKCNRYVITSRKLHKINLSKYLIVQMIRFQYDLRTGTSSKIKKNIKIPFDLEIFGKKYTIKGAVIHFGSTLDGGHYIYISRDEYKNWREFNDENVKIITEIKAKEYMDENAYLIDYKLMN